MLLNASLWHNASPEVCCSAKGTGEGESGCQPEPAWVTAKYSSCGEDSVAGREDMEDRVETEGKEKQGCKLLRSEEKVQRRTEEKGRGAQEE